MGINEIIMYIMMFFMLIAAVDRILSQFGGSARFLGKFGKSIEGSGGQFEEGFMAMGALGLAMVGMTALAPVLAHVLGPVIIPVYEMLGANPSMFAGTLLACDMGGFFLAKELAGGDVAAWLYSGLILGSMMGPTIVFSIPVALGIIEPSDRRYLALGVLAGIDGLCHAMAHQPGAALHIPHGLANAMLLPTVMEFNRMVCRERFSQIGRALRTKKSDDRDAINAVSELIAEVGIGKRLGDVGATSAHYGAWAQAALEDICLRSNPRTASLEQIVGLYAAAQ